MKKILTVDGGGSKLRMILFDDNFDILGKGLSGGVNINQTSLEDCRSNVKDCLNQVFKDERNHDIDRMYLIFVGPVNVLHEELENYAKVKEIISLGEARAGVLAGMLEKEGMLALSGTGSDVFYVREDSSLNSTVGGWGPILGDQGSGTWIGQRALRAIVASVEGWGEKTLMESIVMKELNLTKHWDLVDIVHRSVAPFRKVGSFSRIVELAAKEDDRVALEIIKEAGRIMAVQADCLIKRENVPIEDLGLVYSGGGWRVSPLMFDIFKRELLKLYPALKIQKPIFEPIMAGVVLEAKATGLDKDSVTSLLKEKFSEFVI